MVLSPLLINRTKKFNVLQPDLEAKAKAVHRPGQGQRSSRPRPQNFVLEVEASPRGPPVIFFPMMTPTDIRPSPCTPQAQTDLHAKFRRRTSRRLRVYHVHMLRQLSIIV